MYLLKTMTDFLVKITICSFTAELQIFTDTDISSCLTVVASVTSSKTTNSEFSAYVQVKCT